MPAKLGLGSARLRRRPYGGYPDILAYLLDQVDKFSTDNVENLREASRTANEVSRTTFKSRLSGRPVTSPRPGRPTTQGRFTQAIEWTAHTATSNVSLNLAKLEQEAPYWLIQEIGTGSRAHIGVVKRQKGRGKGPRRTKVKSQVGRVIGQGRNLNPGTRLSWGDGQGNLSSPNRSAFRQHQIVSTGRMNRNMTRRKSRGTMRINREIEGKRYIHRGGKAGYFVYKTDMALAMSAFSRR